MAYTKGVSKFTDVTLRAIYLSVFDNFAMDTNDIAKEFGLDRRDAYTLLQKLQDAGLITGGYVGANAVDYRHSARGRVENHGVCKLWQAWETYDSISHEEAEVKFDAIFRPTHAAKPPVDGFIGIVDRDAPKFIDLTDPRYV
jgi:Mn-dependent DtxR family transcriptional regulator